MQAFWYLVVKSIHLFCYWFLPLILSLRCLKAFCSPSQSWGPVPAAGLSAAVDLIMFLVEMCSVIVTMRVFLLLLLLLLSYLVALCEMPLGFTPSVRPVFSMGEPLNNRYYTAFTNPTHPSRLQPRCRLSFGKTGFPGGCFSALVTSLMQSCPGPQAWPNLPSPVGASSAWACFPETTSETGQSWRHILLPPPPGSRCFVFIS